MKSAVEPSDLSKYCDHKADVDGFCAKCQIYLCKRCQISDHYDHISEIRGLDMVFTQAMQEYSGMISSLDKYLNPAIASLKEGAVDDALLYVEKKISDEYEKMAVDIKEIEEEQVATLKSSPFMAKLQKEKDELEGEELKKISRFDDKLKDTIGKLLDALTNENYEKVQELMTDQSKEAFTKEAQEFEGYYEKQRKFLKHLEVLKAVSPKLTYDPKTIQELIQVKGVHEELLKLAYYDQSDKSIYAYLPKIKTIVKEEAYEIKLYRGFGQTYIPTLGLFLCGGRRKAKDYLKHSYSFFEADKKIQPKAPMLTERAYFGIAAKEDSEIYIIGGENSKGKLAQCENYKILANEWREIPPLTEPKKNPAVCLWGENLVCIGGFRDEDLATIEIFNLGEGKSWERKNVKGEFPICKAGALDIGDNQILIFGGKVERQPRLKCAVLDMAKGEILEKAAMTAGSSFRSGGLLFEGSVYAISQKKRATHIFEVKKNEWSLIEEPQYTLKYNWNN